uniref:Large ribosomal subunit protein uL6 n=1 Tax=Candidatus Methanophagaceae archaeon ANME-1 ERB6 TaxID=2759912 RepID=A0A7G9Z1D2_9EURY|nr:LSU ribosomal protein L6P [uncultured archaeon GZfos10C7]QNO54066.1 50S ribosomal protein L6 [Methanosarcinales archaeon ANME-1 ERB6]
MTNSMEEEAGIDLGIPIPENVNLTISGRLVKVEGPKGAIERELWQPGLRIQIEKRDNGDEVVIRSDSGRKKKRAMAGTYASHLKNMITGVESGFFYRLKVVHAHFPTQIAVAKDGNSVSVSNFLGEKKARIAKIEEGVKVEIKGKGEEIVVSGIDKVLVGQTAANLEQTTRIKGYDPKVFQDGIYLVEKGVGAGV